MPASVQALTDLHLVVLGGKHPSSLLSHCFSFISFFQGPNAPRPRIDLHFTRYTSQIHSNAAFSLLSSSCPSASAGSEATSYSPARLHRFWQASPLAQGEERHYPLSNLTELEMRRKQPSRRPLWCPAILYRLRADMNRPFWGWGRNEPVVDTNHDDPCCVVAKALRAFHLEIIRNRALVSLFLLDEEQGKKEKI